MRLQKIRARVAFEIQRTFRAVWGTALVAVVVVLLWKGWFPDLRQPSADYTRALAAALLAGALAIKVAARVSMGERRRSQRREMLSDIELGLLLLSATYVFLSVLGGSTSPIYPMVYALVSFLVTFHPLKTGMPWPPRRLASRRCWLSARAQQPAQRLCFPGHAGFIAVFAILNVAFLHAEVARQRREHRKRLEEEVLSMREGGAGFSPDFARARADSRLRTRAEEEEKLSQGSIETIHQQLLHTVELLRHALGLGRPARCCGSTARARSSSSRSFRRPRKTSPEGLLSARAGVFAAVLKDGRPCVIESPKLTLLPYYQGPEEVSAFVGVPIFEGRTPRGLLLGDRASGSSFTPSETELFVSAAAQIMRIVQSERVFQAVERSKHEHERFYRASTGAQIGV